MCIDKSVSTNQTRIEEFNCNVLAILLWCILIFCAILETFVGEGELRYSNQEDDYNISI